MNQSNQSLQVSKNDSFSEQNQPNQNHTENDVLIEPGKEFGRYNVPIFAIGTNPITLGTLESLEVVSPNGLASLR
jgi:hypothetical protein